MLHKGDIKIFNIRTCFYFQPRFGVCFDVDGVLARGTIPFKQAVEGLRKLTDEKGELKVPVTFVTNALNRNIDKANQISGWLGIPVRIFPFRIDRIIPIEKCRLMAFNPKQKQNDYYYNDHKT